MLVGISARLGQAAYSGSNDMRSNSVIQQIQSQRGLKNQNSEIVTTTEFHGLAIAFHATPVRFGDNGTRKQKVTLFNDIAFVAR